MPVALPAGTKVYLALAPVDMRKGYDGLAVSVQQILKRDPFSGQLFLLAQFDLAVDGGAA